MALDLPAAMLTFLCVLMGLATLLFLHHWLSEWRRPWRLSEESLLQCPECHCAFIVRRRSQTGRCPRCDRLCEVQRRR